MSNTFNAVLLLNDIANSNKTGRLRVTSNSVIWELFFLEGKLQYASNSLQSLDTIKYYLLQLGFDIVSRINALTNQDISGNHLTIVINKLVNQGHLSSSQKQKLFQALTRDALESLLCISEGEKTWIETNGIQNLVLKNNELLKISSCLKSLENKLQQWQKLYPFILSPYQRPYCKNLSLLTQSAQVGNVSPNVLKQLVRLMRGSSIRELAILIKQDELKLAQLLFPYLKNKVLQIYPPKSPLDQLPLMKSSFSWSAQVQSSLSHSQETVVTQNPITKDQEKCTIVCIDDSRTMLDTIESYLDPEQYEIFTVENPMKSLSFLFQTRPNVILMDISMPGINGNRLCKILKTSPVFQEVPIILISGNTNLLNQEILDATGAVDFLAKPFSKESLQEIVKKYCQHLITY